MDMRTRSVSRLLAGAIAISVCSLAFAQANTDLLGDWKGALVITPPTKAGKAVGQAPPAPKLNYSLTIRKDGTFKTSVTTPDKKQSTSEGKWTVTGTKLTMQIEKRDGKPSTESPRTRTLIIAKDRTTMSTVLEGNVKLRDEKGNERPMPPGVKAPQVILTFFRLKK